MLTREIKLESKEFGPLVGSTLKVRVPENMADCLTLVKSGESDVVARFAEGIVRAQNNGARSRAASVLKKHTKDGKVDTAAALTDLQSGIDGYKYGERAEGTGAPAAPKTPKGRQTKAAASSGNRLFEKCEKDDALLARMIKQGIVVEEEYNEWKAARTEAAAAPATTEATKA